MENKPSKLVPALIGGTVIAVLSAVPIINLGNCLCCMWVILGGVLGSYLYARELPPGDPFPSSDGAVVGLLSGVFGALFGTFLIYFFIAFLGFRPGQEFFQNLLESRRDLSPELEDLVDELRAGGAMRPFFAFVWLVVTLVIDAIFGTVGGIIGAALMKNKGSSDKLKKTKKSK